MKYLFYLIILLIVIFSSCSVANKKHRAGKSKMPADENVTTDIEDRNNPKRTVLVREVEEKLVAYGSEMPDQHHYFVIIGSFLNPENAKKYQDLLMDDGFSSKLLKNIEEFYRISVLATDDINVARNEIRRIRNIYPKYSDVWLLIRKN
jgi:hypothetical protein